MRSKPRLFSATFAIGMSIATASGFAQGVAPSRAVAEALEEMNAAATLAVAAFECTALALNQGDLAPAGEAQRLFEVGHPAAMMAATVMRELPDRREGFGPAAALLFDYAGDEFLVGMMFAGGLQTIEDFLDEQISPELLGNGSFELWTGARELIAANEFARRNCRLIGR